MDKIGKYEIIEILGKGAMGIVYKARDPDIDREVAIKTIRFDLGGEGAEKEEMMERFIREARAAGKLSHPNIITIYEVGREEDLTYIVMEYIEGDSLQKQIVSKKKFSAQEILNLFTPLCDGLDYAHKNKIIHRDIKPANILIDRTGKPFIVDFGVARIETSSMTQTGTTLGTPSYMSPEQVMGKKVDNRSDIFSLGVILFEILTGQRPFGGGNVSTIIYKIVNEEPVSITDIAKNLPEGFEHVIHRALAKDSDKRYNACMELAADLQHPDQAADQTIALDLTREVPGGLKKPRKSKKAVIFVGIVSAIIVIGGGGAWFLTQKPKESSTPSAKKLEMKTDESSIPAQPERTPPSSIEEKLSKIKESFESENLKETIKLAEEVLAGEADNSIAQDYLNKAMAQLNEAEISRFLEAGIGNYKKGNHQQCILEMQKVLKLDKDHEEAKKYIYLADTAISRIDIERFVQSQRQAEEEKDLLTFLNPIEPQSLKEQKREEAMLLFNGYDDIQSKVSNISVKFINMRQATVSFSHILTAVSKNTGQNSIVFEGMKTWKIQKKGRAWKITGFE